MATGVRTVSNVLQIMRVALGRRNENDPDSSDELFLQYLNDFVSLTMSDDVKLFEQFGTLSFTIDGTHPDGVYTFNDVGASTDFVNLSSEAFISLLDPVGGSISWNSLPIFQDPGQFFSIWGVNNEDILIKGYPTMMLYYGNEFTFRTIPQEDVQYMIKIYGYKKNNDYAESDEEIQYDYWLRYLAYGAAMNYARDYRYAPDVKAELKADFAHERKLMLTHTHNQINQSRAAPRF
jgi:hypothetical protein